MKAMRSHFSRNPLERYPSVQNLIWLPNERSGGEDQTEIAGQPDSRTIRIETFDTFNPSQVGSLPAIITSVGDSASKKLGVGNLHAHFGGRDLDGTRTMSVAWAGSIMLFCLSSIPRQSRLIAWESANFLHDSSNQLRCQWQLCALQIASVSSTAPLREFPTVLATKVTLEYGLIESTHVTPDAPLLNKVQYSAVT